MLQKLRKKSGTIELAALVALGIMFLVPTIETAKNGVLKKNGQTIWCKMLNKGNNFCDAKYR